MNLEQIIARQEEKLETLIPKDVDLISRFGEEKLLCSRQAILNWHTSSIKEILEGEIQWLKGEGFVNPSEAGQFALHSDGYNQALDDTINHLESIIKKLK